MSIAYGDLEQAINTEIFNQCINMLYASLRLPPYHDRVWFTYRDEKAGVKIEFLSMREKMKKSNKLQAHERQGQITNLYKNILQADERIVADLLSVWPEEYFLDLIKNAKYVLKQDEDKDLSAFYSREMRELNDAQVGIENEK